MIHVQLTVECTAVGYFQGNWLHKTEKIPRAHTLQGLALVLVTDSRQESALLSPRPGGWGQGIWWSFQCLQPWEGTPGKTSCILMVSSCVTHVALWAPALGSAHLGSKMDKTHEPGTQVQSRGASNVCPSLLRTEAGESAVLGWGTLERHPPLIRKMRKASWMVGERHAMN